MRSQNADPSLLVRNGGELPLSGPALTGLLRAVLERGKPFRFRANGFSMSPLVKDRDVITVSPLTDSTPRCGDTVACVNPEDGSLLVHRVICRKGPGWLIRADNAPEPDGLFSKADLLGRVTRIERDGNRIFFGLGVDRYLIAWLARLGWMPFLKSAFLFPRRLLGSALERLQTCPRYRRMCRGLRKQFSIAEAAAGDREAPDANLRTDRPSHPGGSEPGDADYVARVGNKAVGFVQMVRCREADCPWSGTWLFSLSVKPLYRRFGIGEALVRRVIAQAEAHGSPELFTAVFEDNGRAVHLYRKLGFAPVELLPLVPLLEAEKRHSGRLRIVMRKNIGKQPPA